MGRGRAPTAANQPAAERRRWVRLSLAIPVFVRGIDGQGRECVEFCTLLNESAGGALLAIRRALRRRSRVSLEMPLASALRNVRLRRTKRMLRACVVRMMPIDGWNLCGLQFARPLSQ
jgi:PilZ domain-containing protein